MATKTIHIFQIFTSRMQESSILERFRRMQINMHRGDTEELAVVIKPVIRGINNYNGKFPLGYMPFIRNQFNARSINWVK